MTIEELVAKQQLEIENLREENDALWRILRKINKLIQNGPLNESYRENNVKYTEEQREIFYKIQALYGGSRGPFYDHVLKNGAL